MKRNGDIDFIKGVAIFLMVFAHAATYWTPFDPIKWWIALFHMPVFFMATGYFFKREYVVSIKGCWHFMLRKVAHLWWPYVASAIVCIVLQNLLIDCNIYTDNVEFMTNAPAPWNHLMNRLEWSDICRRIWHTFLLRDGSQLVGSMWFVKTLFFASICYGSLSWIVQRTKANYLFAMSSVCLGLALFARYFYQGDYVLNYIDGQRTFLAIVLIHLGFCMREFGVKKILNSSKISVVILLGSAMVLIAARCLGTFISLSSHRVSSVISLLLVSFIGWMMLYSLSRISENTPQIFRGTVRYMGRHSFSILIFHILAFRIVNGFGVLLLRDPLYMIAGNPTAY